jgi:hypothetical protein
VTVDELVAELDRRGEPWDLYRGGGGTGGKVWVVCLGLGVDTRDDRGHVRRFRASTLLDVLEMAVSAGPPLPVVPRRPWVPVRSAFTVLKTGSKWGLDYEGRPFLGNFATKKAAWECAETTVARHERAAVEWDATHGIWLVGRVEGADFRWAS